MKTTPRLAALAVLSTLTAVVVHAHPGHDHTDIPSVLRHPFAGPEHLLISAAAGLAVGALVFVLMRRVPMPALVRWAGAGTVAVAVTFTLAI